MKRRFRPFAAWVAMAALLFAQLATAAYACPQMVDPAAAAAPSDCEHETAATPSLCKRHCDGEKASVDNPKPASAPAMLAVFARPIVVVMPAMQIVHAAPFQRVATGPPFTRFTVLRI
jgi:hypothetical protein